MTKEDTKAFRQTLSYIFTSPNEMDSNYEIANVVDGLFAVARAFNRVAEAINNLAEAQKER